MTQSERRDFLRTASWTLQFRMSLPAMPMRAQSTQGLLVTSACWVTRYMTQVKHHIRSRKASHSSKVLLDDNVHCLAILGLLIAKIVAKIAPEEVLAVEARS